MEILAQARIRWTFYQMQRRAAPRRGFERALLAEIQGRRASWFTLPQLAFARLAVPIGVLVLSFVATGTYAYTSDNVNAAHPLYRFKRRFEAYQEQMVKTPEQRARFFQKKSDRRLAEGVTLSRINPDKSIDHLDDSLSLLQRSVQAVSQIPDPEDRRRAIQVFLQGDGDYLVRVQSLVVERPEAMRPVVRRVLQSDRARIRSEVQALHDPELRAVLQARMLAHEAMLQSSLLTDAPVPAE